MFEQSMIERGAKTNRGWPVVASLLLQVSGISVAILVPLVNPELLPRAFLSDVFRVAPPLPPAPKPAPAPTDRPRVQTTRTRGDVKWLAPPTEIHQVKLIDDRDLTSPVGVPGMDRIGSYTDGVPNSFVNDIARAAHVTPPPPPTPAKREPEPPKPTERIRVGGVVQDAMVISRVTPLYPKIAMQLHQEGKVLFSAVIGRDGTIQQLQVMNGSPLFVQAATEAVRQWRYRPTMLNGDPVEVLTTIEVTFRLNR